MNKRLYLVFTGFLLVAFSVKAQDSDWRSSTLDGSSNYFEIINKERKVLKRLKGKTDKKSKKQIKQFERWAAFWKDRILPDGSFVSAAHTYNEWQKEQLKQKNSTSRRYRGVSAANWSLVGPIAPPTTSISYYPGMGRLNAVAFNGTDTNTIYVGSPAGGVWKTTNGGTSWTPKGDEFPNMGVSDIVINPVDTNILYLATGDWDGVHNRSVGVLKSINGGDTWATTGLTFTLGQNDIISKLLIDPNNVNTVFATTENSIKRTTDGGLNWFDVQVDNGAKFNDIIYKIGSSSIIYATTNSGKFYISTNNGANWSLASSPSSSREDIALTANDVDLILILGREGAVKKSTDQGSSWTTLSTIASYASQGAYNMALAISPVNKNLVLAGGMEGWRSTDGGVTWEKYLDGYWESGDSYFYVHSDHHDIKFVPGSNIAFSVNDGGIFKGDASLGTAWTDLSSGLAITQYYNVSGTPQNANLLIAGAQDNDIAIYNGSSFTGENPGSDGVDGLWDYSNSNIAWTCSQSGILNRTMDGFSTSEDVSAPGIDAPFIWQVDIHPTIPTTIFGGYTDIYKSTNRGDVWTSLNSGISYPTVISIAPSNGDIISIFGTGGMKTTTDGGTSWSTINLPQVGTVKSIEIHPTNTAEIYISYSGYPAGKVYKSTDSGANWTNITGSLPDVPTHKILYKTGSTDGELFLATDLGVYYRTDTAGDWVKLGSGLPNIIVHDLEIHYSTEKLRAATYGRGIWELPVDATSLGLEKSQLPQNAVVLFPNPTLDKNFTIKLNDLNGETNIIIYNVIGSVVKEFKTSSIEEKVNLSSFSNGLYLVKLTNNNKSIIKKIIVD